MPQSNGPRSAILRICLTRGALSFANKRLSAQASVSRKSEGMTFREVRMDQRWNRKNCSDEEASRNALSRMIIKLRWIGLEDEARQLELEARRLPAEQRCGVSLYPFSTD
jgi:hypothetical protein